MDRTRPRCAGRRARRPAHDPVEANARLTSGTAVVLLVPLAAEGITILRIRGLISVHVFIGMLLVPPVLVKTCSTVYRFARYYLGAAMTLHVLGHLLDTARVAPRDWLRRTRRNVTGAGLRQWTIAASLLAGL